MMRLTPGYGTEQVHLGQDSRVLKALFGPPEKRRKTGTFREYWLYPARSIEGIVSRRSGRILSLFFRPEPEAGAPFGMTEAEIRDLYSDPAREGGGLELMTGSYIGRWLSYDSGIGFHFDKAGRVEVVSIFAAKRKPGANAATAHSAPQIAALRIA